MYANLNIYVMGDKCAKQVAQLSIATVSYSHHTSQ